MQIEYLSHPEVPWTIRDVCRGVGYLGLWMILAAILSMVINVLAIRVDVGVFLAIGEALLILPVWGLTVFKYRVSWGTLGLRHFTVEVAGLGCGLMVLSYFFNMAYSVFILAPFNLSIQGDLLTRLAQSPWSGFLWVGGAIIAPFVEEIFFRGFIFAGLRQVYGWQKSAIISSALFALVHLQWTAIPPIFVLGYIFAYLYNRSRSLWPAILMHGFSNVIALGTVYLLYR
jgi:membrane protease YdiL (CAAX protease family)